MDTEPYLTYEIHSLLDERQELLYTIIDEVKEEFLSYESWDIKMKRDTYYGFLYALRKLDLISCGKMNVLLDDERFWDEVEV